MTNIKQVAKLEGTSIWKVNLKKKKPFIESWKSIYMFVISISLDISAGDMSQFESASSVH